MDISKRRDEDKQRLTNDVNETWRDVYINIGAIDTQRAARITGNSDFDEQCLRVAWTLYHDHQPKNWRHYEGFKEYIELRVYDEKRVKAQKDIETFMKGLPVVSKHYCIVVSPYNSKDKLIDEEQKWLTKIHNTRNIAKFLPLIIAARVRCTDEKIERDGYIRLLEALECFAFRVNVFGSKRHSIAQSKFYRWGKDLFEDMISVDKVVTEVYALIRYYSNEKEFRSNIETPSIWYKARYSALKYILFEYESHLCEKGAEMKIQWENVGDSTIEHILPQHPAEDSHWHEEWPEEDIEIYRHDIGNLVLTHNNSNYSNKEFAEKKGSAGEGTCYSNSNVRQELQIAQYDRWTKETLEERRQKLVDWVVDRWKTKEVAPASDVNEDEDDEY